MNYYDVHVFISRSDGYSIPVAIQPIQPNHMVEGFSDDEVIDFASEMNMFTEEGDENHVDRVTSISKEEFNEMKGIPNG